jgi:glycosyltransferase involved in cell wall biosynthesis
VRLTFLTGTPASVRHGSGTSVGIAVLRQALERLGHEVYLVTPRSSHAPFGLTAWRLGFNLALAARPPAAGDLTVGFDMDGFLLRGGEGRPYLASIKGVLADELTFERGATRRLLALQAWCEARNVRRAPLVVTTSRYAAQRLARHYAIAPHRLRLAPELIDLAGWQAALAAAEDVSVDEPTVLAVAHMYPRKSLDVLLRALALLPDRWQHLHLRLVGVGPEEQRLRAAARRLGLGRRVTFLGHVSRARLAAEYRSCTLFCLPSRQEGFGIVFLEAMAAGKAVVACRAGAVPEVVRHGETGVLVGPADPAALADAITQLLDNPAQRAALGAAGLEHVRAYDAALVAQRFLQVAEEAAAIVG